MLAIATFGAVAVLLFHTPTKYGSDRFRQIFIDHWERWWDYRREEIPADQRAYVQKTVEKMMGCRNPQSGYARYVCPECHEERIVPFSCKTRFCPSCGKVRTDEWVNRIAQELLDVPHLHLTLKPSPLPIGHDPLECPNCQTTLVLVEIWEPQRRYIWMKRWLETHRRRRAARELLKRLQANRPQKAQQLAFGFL